MFKNRSFENLLGRLYQPGEVALFEGVLDKELSNPIPSWAEHGADRGTVLFQGRGDHEHDLSRARSGCVASGTSHGRVRPGSV